MLADRMETRMTNPTHSFFGTMEALHDTLPREIIIHHIWRFLPVTSRRAWRVADRVIATFAPVAKDSRPWEKMLKQFRYGICYTDYAFLFQCAYDNNLPLTEMRLKTTKLSLQKDTISFCAEAAAMGGATEVFSFLKTKYPGLDVDRCAHVAMANGRFEFLRDACQRVFAPHSPEWFAFLDSWEKPDHRSDPSFSFRSTANDWARHGRADLLTPYIQHRLRTGTATEYGTEKLLLIVAAHGYVDIIEVVAALYPDFWKPTIIPYICANGKSPAGLQWFQENRPEFFARRHKFIQKPRSLVKCACRRGSPAVLAWLIDNDFLDPRRDGKLLVDIATKQGHTRTLQWFTQTYVLK